MLHKLDQELVRHGGLLVLGEKRAQLRREVCTALRQGRPVLVLLHNRRNVQVRHLRRQERATERGREEGREGGGRGKGGREGGRMRELEV